MESRLICAFKIVSNIVAFARSPACLTSHYDQHIIPIEGPVSCHPKHPIIRNREGQCKGCLSNKLSRAGHRSGLQCVAAIHKSDRGEY